MNSLKQLRAGMISQSRNTWKTLFLLYLTIGLFFLVIGLLSRISANLTLAMLMRDAVISGRLPVLAGVVAQLELVLWSASLVVCVFSWAVVRQRRFDTSGPGRFLIQFSLVTAIMLVDDLFQFHGDVAPKYLGIHKSLVLAVYLVLMLYFLFSNWTEVLSSEYFLLLLAMVLFSASSFLDVLPLDSPAVPHLGRQARYILEDAVKFAGIATWLAYFARYAYQKVTTSSAGNS